MSVSDSQIANAATFNAAFGSKSTDNTFSGKQTLTNADSVSGDAITNLQTQHNASGSFTGSGVNGLKTQLPTWSTNAIGTSGDNLQQRSEALTAAVASKLNSLVVDSWMGDTDAPIEDVEFTEKVWLYNRTDAGNQKLIVYVRVPLDYQGGGQISMSLAEYSPSASNTILISSTTTLIRSDTDAIDSTTNQHSSTNAALGNTVANQYRAPSLDLSDGSGDINSVAVSAGDLLKIELFRGTDTDTADIRFVPSATEVRFL